MQTYQLLFSAPIPVGHGVELRWYEREVVGILSGRRFERDDCRPLVKDLDTGITYGDFALFQHGSVLSFSQDHPTSLTDEPHPRHRLADRVVGRVVSCRIASHLTKDWSKFQTTLCVEVQRTEG